MTDVWHVPADDGSGTVEIRPSFMVSGDAVAVLTVAITEWLGDELERNNVPDRYAEWFDHAELAAALVSVLKQGQP